MKAKRILAMILSVAMIATSSNFTLETKAAQMTDMPIAVTTVSGGEVSGSDVTPSDVTPSDVTPSDVTPGDVTAGDVTTGDVTGDVTSGNVTGGDVTTGDATGGDVTGGDVTTGDATGGDVTGGDVTTGDVTGGDGAKAAVITLSSDYFDMDENGVLLLKDGMTLSKLPARVNLPAEVRVIPAGIFNSKDVKTTSLVIPDASALEEIKAGAFEGSLITKIKIPDAVTYIGAKTFKDSKLGQIDLDPESRITEIGEEAFAGSNLTMITMPAGLSEVGKSAFRGCLDLQSVRLVNTTVVGDYAFKGCTKLTMIAWGESLESVGAEAFSGIGLSTLEFDADKFAGIEWGESVFAQCKSLTRVVLNDTLEMIPQNMFKDCTAILYVALPENCVEIGNSAFSGCTTLSSISIPARVGYIGSKAFGACQSLGEVKILQRGNGERGEADIIIADDAFPIKELTMSGYDGTVLDYAERKDYKYKSLYESYKVSVKIKNDEYGEVSLSKKEAKKGEMITVTVEPKAEYRLKASSFNYNGILIDQLVEDTGTSQVFRFEMPDADTVVNVEFEKVSSYSNLKGSTEFYNDNIHVWDGKLLTFEQNGLAARLIVDNVSGTKRTRVGSWLFTYTTNKASVATVDENGIVYARGAGDATITATLKSDTSKTVTWKVKVNKYSKITAVSADYSSLGRGKQSYEVIEGTGLDVIQYTKTNLSKEEKTFNVVMKPVAGSDPQSLFANIEWKSSNPNIAYPEKDVTLDNRNIIHVCKGVSGETAITVKVTNGLTGTKREVLCEKTFIVRVRDVNPRLVQTRISLNALSTDVTPITLISVYGYEVETTDLSVVQAKKKNGIMEYIESDYVYVGYDNGTFFMELSEAGKDKVVSDGKDTVYTNLCIQGKYTYETDHGPVTETFYTPIKELVLTQKAPKPSVKISGKINLFFSSEASVAERGEVTVKQTVSNVTNAVVESYELVSAANYAKEGSEEVDSFANNFDISENGVISRSENELKTDAKGKPVTSGYLKITYKGYEKPCFVKIKVPISNTKPSYVLSSTKATVNINSTGYEIKLKLLDKKTKKQVSLANLRELSFNESSKGTTEGLFKALDTEDARATDEITLKLDSIQKGKAVINVEMDTWNEPLAFTFNISVNTKSPVVSAKPSTLTLNNVCVGRAAETKLVINQADVFYGVAAEPVFKGRASQQAEAAKIAFDYDEENHIISAYATDQVKKGSYKFQITPVAAYRNGLNENLKPVTITVKVIDTTLSAKLKSSTITVNNRYAGRETAKMTYTITNLPVSEGIEIDSSAVTITGSNTAATNVRSAFDFAFNEDETKITVKQNRVVTKGSYKYKISGLKVVIGTETSTIKDFYITVKVIDTQATISVKASGTLNTSDRSSYISYALTLKNSSARIVDIELKELDTTKGKDNYYEEPVHFEIQGVSYDANSSIAVVYVGAKSDAVLDARGNYKIRLAAYFEDGTADKDDAKTSDLKIQPKQVLPKIKTDVTETTLYAGVAPTHPKRSQEVLITKTTQMNAEIASVQFSKNTPDNVKKAFRVTFDNETQKAKITLVRPDLLKPNSTYTVNFEVKVIDQMVNTTGPQFTMKIKVVN